MQPPLIWIFFDIAIFWFCYNSVLRNSNENIKCFRNDFHFSSLHLSTKDSSTFYSAIFLSFLHVLNVSAHSFFQLQCVSFSTVFLSLCDEFVTWTPLFGLFSLLFSHEIRKPVFSHKPGENLPKCIVTQTALCYPIPNQYWSERLVL